MSRSVHVVLEVKGDTLVCANCGEVKVTFKHGIPKCPIGRREQRGFTPGYRRVWRGGYIAVTCEDGVERAEHRIVMEKMIGRPLLRNETVHHRNGDRTDNRPENLELWSKTQPAGQRVSDKIKWAREIIALYGDLETKNPAALGE